MLGFELIHDKFEAPTPATPSLQDIFVFETLDLSDLGNSVPVHLQSELVHDIGHLPPPHIHLPVHGLKQISVADVHTVKLVAFVVVYAFVVELNHHLLERDPYELDQGVQ